MRLASYLERVGVSAPLAADEGSLRRLHAAHRERFLFENLTIQTGGTISLALPDLERKFLDEGRGGYCFEHNSLFAAALGAIGFAPVTLLGRVRGGAPERRCRTHMVLRVPGVPTVLCDVGFGGLGLLEPIALLDGATAVQGGLEYRIRREDHLWVLAMRDAAGERDLYEVPDDPQTPWDVEIANHFTATHPESPFRRMATIQRASRDERVILRGTTVVRYRGGVRTEESIAAADVPRYARELFGVEWPAGPLVCDQYSSAKLTT